MKHLVVSRYKEDLSWLDEVPEDINIYLYNKGESSGRDDEILLPNIGREAHTFLYHVINNWFSFPDYFIFSQGNPFDHDSNFLKKISDNESYKENKIVYLSNMNIIEGLNGNKGHQHPDGIDIKSYLTKLQVTTKQTSVNFAPGAQYIVPMQKVRRFGIHTYKRMLGMIESSENPENPIEAYAYERIWSILYGKTNTD